MAASDNGRVAGPAVPLNPYSDCPPRGATPIYPVVYVRVGQPLHCLVLGERSLGVWHHYRNGKTEPCLKAWSACEGCEGNAPVVWSAYVAVYVLPQRRKRVLQIPASAYRECLTLAANQGRLRGTALQVNRMGTAKNAPVQVRVCERREGEPLPTSFNPGETLVHLWGLTPTSPAARSFVFHGAMASVREGGPSGEQPGDFLREKGEDQ
jgi:hypothetical protein